MRVINVCMYVHKETAWHSTVGTPYNLKQRVQPKLWSSNDKPHTPKYENVESKIHVYEKLGKIRPKAKLKYEQTISKTWKFNVHFVHLRKMIGDFVPRTTYLVLVRALSRTPHSGVGGRKSRSREQSAHFCQSLSTKPQQSRESMHCFRTLSSDLWNFKVTLVVADTRTLLASYTYVPGVYISAEKDRDWN